MNTACRLFPESLYLLPHTAYPVYGGAVQCCSRGAMSAGGADAAVRWDSCRLDFFAYFFYQEKKYEEKNMNGRLYDPVIGRFFSPDNFVQDFTSTQNYNRYSYALNNPLKYTDPSGQDRVKPTYNTSSGKWEMQYVNDDGGDTQQYFDFYVSGGGGGGGGAGGDGYLGSVMLMGSRASVDWNRVQGFGFELLGGSSSGKFSDGIKYWDRSIGGSRDITRMPGYNPLRTTTMLDAAVVNASRNSNYYLFFNEKNLYVIDTHTSKIVYSTNATSGKGEHMNNPASQHIKGQGPIPAGKYSYKNSDWKPISKIKQIGYYGAGLLRIPGGGDWGDYRVTLNVIDNNNSDRDGFFLHGGVFDGSAGCIDAGKNIGRIYQLTNSQLITYLIVKY